MKENIEAGEELSDTLMTHERIQKNFQISSDIFSAPSPKDSLDARNFFPAVKRRSL
jgi:hypothetical protein